MRTILSVAAGVLGAGYASAAPLTNGPDDVTPSVSLFLGERSGEPATGEPTSPLGSLATLYDDGQTKVTWGGRLMEDFGWFDVDDGYPDPGADGVEVRRARFFAAIEMEHVEAKIEFDFAGGDADFTDVWISLPTPIGKLKVGHQFHPYSLEQLTSSRFITFMERAAIVEALSPARDNGATTGGRVGEDTGWAVGVFKISDDFAESTGDGDSAVTGRVTHAIGEADSVVHLGLAASLWSAMDVRFRTRPEAHLLDRVLDTGTVSSDGTMLLGAEAAWVEGPLSLQGEWMQGSIDEFGGGSDVDIDGFYAFVSYFLTGESRNYSKKSAKFDRVKPKENWTGEWFSGGAWELALRYSMVDYGDVDGSELSNVTLGTNWYLNPYTRMMVNVLSSNFDDGASVDDDMLALMLRLQIDW